MKFKELQKPFLKLLGAGALPQFLLLAISPVLTRLFTPDDFGMYGIFIALSATMAAVSGGRLEFAIPVSKTLTDASALFLVSTVISIPVSCLLTYLIWLLIGSGYLGNTGLYTVLKEFWFIFPFSVFSIISYQALQYWLLRSKNYHAVAMARWSQGLSLASLHLTAGFWSFGAWGLILCHALAQMVGVIFGLNIARGKISRQLRNLTSSSFWRLLVLNRSYPSVMVPATVFNMLGQHLPVLLVGALYGTSSAGMLAIAQRLCGAPLALIAQAIGQIYVAEAPRVLEVSSSELPIMFVSLVKRLLLAAIIPLAIILMAAPYLVRIAFGEEWYDAGVLMQILGIVFVLDFVITPVSLTLTFTQNFVGQLSWDVARVVSIIVVFVLGAVFSLTLYETISMLAVVLSVCSICYIGLMWRGLKKYSGKSF